jgi:hypothetical protein
MATDLLQHVPSEAFPYLSTTYIVVLAAPGTNFIQHVLEQIGRENVNRTQTLLRFVHDWTLSNINRFMDRESA